MNRHLLLTGLCIAAISALTNLPDANAQTAKIQKGTGSSVLINSSAQKTSSTIPSSFYQLSVQRTELIKSIIDLNADAGKNIESAAVTKKILDDVAKQMPLTPAAPVENMPVKELNDKARAMMEEEFGSDTAKYEKHLDDEAAKEYPIFKQRDTVTVQYTKGRNQYRITGKVVKITDSYVIINDTSIDMVDLSGAERSKFDLQKNKQLRELYVETHRAEFARQRNERIQENILKLKEEIFKHNEAAGYIYDPLADTWSNARECAQSQIKSRSQKIQAEKEVKAKKDTVKEESENKTSGEAVKNSAAVSPKTDRKTPSNTVRNKNTK